jgi:hypothetical protein
MLIFSQVRFEGHHAPASTSVTALAILCTAVAMQAQVPNEKRRIFMKWFAFLLVLLASQPSALGQTIDQCREGTRSLAAIHTEQNFKDFVAARHLVTN